MRRLALFAVALACMAITTAPPAIAAPHNNAFRVTAQSDELRPNVVATSATDAAITVANTNRALHIVPIVWYARLMFVGYNPYSRGHIRLTGDRHVYSNWT